MFARSTQAIARKAVTAESLRGPCRFLGDSAKKKYVLEYHYVDNMLEKRAPVRADHLAVANKAVESGLLIAGGALMPDVKRGILILQGSEDEVRNFAESDPYVARGLVRNYTITEWNVVVGSV